MNQQHEQDVPKKFRFYSIDELKRLPPPEWLIDDVVPKGRLAVLYGESDIGKSFVALDMALSVASGRSWQGKQTSKGRVVYVAAEGGWGITQRIVAWMEQHRLDAVRRAFFLLEAVMLDNRSDVDELVAALKRELGDNEPVLVVLDTFAQCFAGEENSAKEVGLAIKAAGSIQRAWSTKRVIGPSVLLVHHTGKNPFGKERGSSALRAAADVMMEQKESSRIITIKNDKQKDAAKFDEMTMKLSDVSLGRHPKTGKRLTSCILTPTSAKAVGGEVLHGSLRQALDVLHELGRPAMSGEWAEAIGQAKGKTVSMDTFQKWRGALVKQGLVESHGGTPPKYLVSEAGKKYVASATGMPRRAA